MHQLTTTTFSLCLTSLVKDALHYARAEWLLQCTSSRQEQQRRKYCCCRPISHFFTQLSTVHHV